MCLLLALWMMDIKNKRKFLYPGLLALVTVCLSACEPLGPFAGSKIAGEQVAVPESWSELNATEVVQIETQGPYCVNVWGVGLDRDFYVASSRGPNSRWAKRISLNSNVRLRIAGSIYPLDAITVTDVAELSRVAVGFTEKYELDASQDFPEAVVYRLDRR